VGLCAHAAAGPHRPWLFAARGWDWRWLAWGEAEARVAAAAAELRPRVEELADRASRPSRLAFRYEPRPAAVLLDLAIQAAGAVPVPVSPRSSEWASESAPERPEGMDGWVEPPAVLDPERPAPREAVWPEGLPVDPPAGVGVREPGGAVREISAPALAAAARELAQRIGSRERDVPSREIVVSARPLDNPEERLLLAWALRTGAAVVLEPRPESHVVTARWVRPTVFAGDVTEVVALGREAESYRSPPLRRLGRWLRRRWGGEAPGALPFDRLGTVLLRPSVADRELPEALVRDWERRGVRFLRI